MFKSISLKLKLMSVSLITAGLVIVVSYLNIQAIRDIHASLTNIVDSHLPRLTALRDMRATAITIDKETTIYELKPGSVADLAEQKTKLLTSLHKLSTQEKDYLVLIGEVADKEKHRASNAFKSVSDAKDKTINAVSELITLREQRAPASIIAAKESELAAAEQALESSLTNAIEQDIATITGENVAANVQVEQITLLTILWSALAGAIATLLGLIVSVSVGRNVKKLKEGSTRLASGDFSGQITVDSRDELGQLATLFNQMSTSLRASYLRLALEKERDETLLESMNEGMVALDDKGNIALINSMAATLLNVDAKARGSSFDASISLLTQDGKPVAPENLPSSTLRTGLAINEVFSVQTQDRHKLLMNIASSPVKLNDHIAGAILIMRDVTKEKEVDRMKTEFISLASHQLRTPLSAIKWFGEMLMNGDAGKLTSEQLEFTKNIADSTDRMVELVNALLNISRIESGRIIVDPRPTDLKELITGIVNDLKAKTEERQQNLVISVHADLPKINLDPRLISQVYLNLLTNAIKYTPKQGEIAVFISRKGDDIISQITDNGYGIPKAQQGRMFQKFFRAENIIKVETDGTGLGLYLIKAIVESSGGKIWFESEENKGTTFWFTIPVSGMKAKEGEVTLDA